MLLWRAARPSPRTVGASWRPIILQRSATTRDIIDKHLSEEERLFSADTRSEEVVTGDAWAAPEVAAREASRGPRQLRDESKRDQHRVKARKKNGLDDAEAFCGSLRAWAAPVLTDHAAGSTRASGKARCASALLAEVKRRGERCVVFTQHARDLGRPRGPARVHRHRMVPDRRVHARGGALGDRPRLQRPEGAGEARDARRRRRLTRFHKSGRRRGQHDGRVPRRSV